MSRTVVLGFLVVLAAGLGALFLLRPQAEARGHGDRPSFEIPAAPARELEVKAQSIDRDSISQAQESDSISEMAASDWRTNETLLTSLREAWREVHEWNVNARIQECAERMAGTLHLAKTLELAGNLLEDRPLELADFQGISEHERAAVSTVIQRAANRRVKYGKRPADSLAEKQLGELYGNVLEVPLDYPTRYLPEALGVEYQTLPDDKRQRMAGLRIMYLSRLAPHQADLEDRKTSALHLLRQNGLLGKEKFDLARDTMLLDPSLAFLQAQIREVEAEYQAAVLKLIAE